MSQKPHQRRGLGRGLGSLIPTGPRPEAPEPAGEEGDATTTTIPRPGSADWIGVPLPGDRQPAGTLTAVDLPSGRREDEPTTEHESQDAAAPVLGDLPADEAPGPDQAAGPDPAAGLADVRLDGSEPGVGQQSGEQPGSGAPVLQPVAGAYFAELPVGSIRPNPRQPREVFDEEAMAELVHSVQEVGLLQPVVVRAAADGGFELVMGERRWRASTEAGLDTIPAIVRETGDDDLLRDALLENLHRAELNALEEAAAYQQLLEDFGCTHDELATRLGRSRPQISNTIRLLKLSPAVQRRVAAGVLSAGHARALLGVVDAHVQDRLASRVVAEGISVRALEEIVAVGDVGSPSAHPARRSRPTAPGVEDLAARLSDRLETRVKVDLGRRKGRITVEFASLPDLERIIALIDPGHPTRTRHDLNG